MLLRFEPTHDLGQCQGLVNLESLGNPTTHGFEIFFGELWDSTFFHVAVVPTPDDIAHHSVIRKAEEPGDLGLRDPGSLKLWAFEEILGVEDLLAERLMRTEGRIVFEPDKSQTRTGGWSTRS